MRQSRVISRLKAPLLFRRVRGQSMQPLLKPGQLVVFSSLKMPRHGDIVLAQVDGVDYVKRLWRSDAAGYLSLVGDNMRDSRDFLDVSDSVIRGTLIVGNS